MERLREARDRAGEREGAVFGTATIDGYPVVLLAMDFRFLGGSMGSAVGEAVASAADTAAPANGARWCWWCASGGARMQEGVLYTAHGQDEPGPGPAAMRRACSRCASSPTRPSAESRLRSRRWAASSWSESGALVGFAGSSRHRADDPCRRCPPRLPDGAEFLLAHGLVDRVENRAALRPLLAQLVRLHARHDIGPGIGAPDPVLAASTEVGGEPLTDDEAIGAASAQNWSADADAWDVVQRARDIRSSHDTGLPARRVQRLRRAARGPLLRRLTRRSWAALPRIGSAGSVVVIGPPEGARHPGARRAQLRHAASGGVPQGAAPDASTPSDCGCRVVTPDRHPGRVPGRRRRRSAGQAIAIAELIARSTRLPVPIVSRRSSERAAAVVRWRSATADRRADAGATRSTRSSARRGAQRSCGGRRPQHRRPPAPCALPRLTCCGSVSPTPSCRSPQGVLRLTRRRPLRCCGPPIRAALTEVCDLDVTSLLAERQRRFRSVGQLSSPAATEPATEPATGRVRIA